MPCLLEVLMIPMIDTITLIPVKTSRVTLTSHRLTVLSLLVTRFVN